MSLRILCLVFLLHSALPVAAQQEGGLARNSLYFEALGNNGTWSLNYEHLFRLRPSRDESLGISAGFNLPFSIFPLKIPLEVKYLRGSRHALELGAGLTLGTANWFDEGEPDRLAGTYGVIRAGYRFTSGHFLFRAAPMLHFPRTWSSALWGGISLGYTF
ncbi:MAG: hypothetical protein ACOYXB_14780 [Bacteroidota bacterium]